MKAPFPLQHVPVAALLLSLSMSTTTALSAQDKAASADPLLFPKDSFTLETQIVKTAAGERTVIYRSYQHLLYVAKPVDKSYQSLDVKVPVSIDGKPVDAAHAPILFVVGIGGYMSASNYRTGPGGAPGSLGGRPGGPEGFGPPPGFGGPDGPQGAKDHAGPGGMPPFRGANGTMGGPQQTQNLALAAGYVIVAPGARGRDNKAADGTNYGKAPAAIVDLKAAVRYIRHNKGILPGNTEQIVSSGCSAGGGLSALLGASGNSPLYDADLDAIGAAKERDNIFASGCGSPVTDLEHADQSYEWAFGASKTRSGTMDAAVSAKLKALFPAYEASLQLTGKDGFGPITVNNLDRYLVEEYFAPSAAKYLLGLSEEKRKTYLAANPWLHWDGKKASFSYLEMAAQHITRMKQPPAFDSLTLRSPEANLFGDKSTDARHFTDFSLQQSSGKADAHVDPELEQIVHLMNPMYFTGLQNPDAAQHWWIRHGAIETDSAPTNTVNLALSLEKMGRDVNAAIYWEAGHCQDLDPEGFITWIGKITGDLAQ